MTVKELKKILEEYDDEVGVQIAIHGFEEVYNYEDIYIDYQYETNDAIVIFVEDECLSRECE